MAKSLKEVRAIGMCLISRLLIKSVELNSFSRLLIKSVELNSFSRLIIKSVELNSFSRLLQQNPLSSIVFKIGYSKNPLT